MERKKLSFFIGGIFMNAKETLDLISKQWCTTEDLMKLANVSRPTAMKYKKEIAENVRNRMNELGSMDISKYLNKK